MEKTNISFLSGNALKIIAAITMFIDHLGFIFFPYTKILRIIGRISFPIFAFFIAEGCRYTKNKLRYFLLIAISGTVFQLVSSFFIQNSKMNIFITFSLSILIIFPLQSLKYHLFCEQKSFLKASLYALATVGAVAFAYLFTRKLPIDYNFSGCMVAVFASLFMLPKGCENSKFAFFDKIPIHVLTIAIALLYLSLRLGGLQIYSLLALPLLLCYSGKRGKLNMKYFFYIFYPVHLVLLYSVFELLTVL